MSCLVSHFRRYIALSEREKELLQALEEDPRSYRRKATLRREGEPASTFFTVMSGWLYAYRDSSDGSRQVLDIYLPGQVAGLREVAYQQSLTTLCAVTDAVVCPFPKARLTELFDESRRLNDLFFLFLARENALLVERIVNLGQKSAPEKLAHFLVELQYRLSHLNSEDSDVIRLPISQEMIGDALGLSAVHVNRSLKTLQGLRLIEQHRSEVRILDAAGLTRLAAFNPSYLNEDHDWLRIDPVVPPGLNGNGAALRSSAL